MESANYFEVAIFIYLLSTILYIAHFIFQRERIPRIALLFVSLGFIAHTLGLIHRSIEASHAPFANLYESMVFFSWCILLVHYFIIYKYKIRVLSAFVTPLAFLAIGAASVLPMDYKKIEPLVPALQSYWLSIHVSVCFLSYAAFAIAFATALMFIIQEKRIKYKKIDNFYFKLPSLEILDEVSYRSIAIGFPLLTLGIITGAIWAQNAWGRYWGWDPKETWSLITWIVYALYLHIRLQSGWRRKKAAILSIIGFTMVLFTYFGVSFLLSGLHSY
ncbi:MAG: c-type cytochrome biogenesis protein CcsB [bacterium]|nr:c-type cytochrome biogenesis protein CcsB [bacterium]